MLLTQDQRVKKMLRKLLVVSLAFLMMFSSISYAGTIKYKEEQLNTDIEILSEKSEYYVLDAKPTMFGEDPFAVVSNVIFGLHKTITRMICILLINAFTLNLYTLFSAELMAFMEPLRLVVFDAWLPLVLGLTLVYFLLQAGSGKTTSMVSELIKLGCVLTFALYFLSYPTTIITLGKDVSSMVANELVNEVFIKDTGLSVEDGVAVLVNEVWKAQVDKPWRILNFRDKSDVYHDQFLALEPDSDEREKATKSLRKDVRVKSSSWVLTSVLIGLTSIPELFIYIALAGMAIASEPLVLFLVCASVFIFIIALAPRFGSSVILKLIESLLLVFAIRTIAMALLTFFLFLNDIIYSGLAPQEMIDLIAISTIKAVIIALIIVFRKTLFRIVTFGRRGAKNIQREVNRNVSPSRQFAYDVRDARQSFSSAADKFQGAKSFGDRFRNKASDQFEDEPSNEDNTKRQSSYQDWFNNAREHARSYQDRRQDFKSKDDMASDFLKLQYFYEKRTAEEYAQEEFARTGEYHEPDYSDFVKETKFNYENDLEPFSKAQRMNIIKQMNHLESIGEDPLKIFDRFIDKEDDSAKDDFNADNQDTTDDNSETNGNKNQSSYDEYIFREEMKQNMNFNNTINQNSTTRQMGKAYLHNQYMNQKLDAHVDARIEAVKTGKSVAPEYNDFVQKVNGRIQKNHNMFTKDEIARAEEKVIELIRYGFDPVEHIKTMNSEDVSDIMNSEDKSEKTYDMKDIATDGVSFKALENVLRELDGRVDEKLEKVTDASKIDYKMIKDIMENDIRESKSIEEIRDDVMKLHKDMNQPFNDKAVEQLAKRVSEKQDFEAIAAYVDSLEGRSESEKEDSLEDN
jgi:hypothetical protein